MGNPYCHMVEKVVFENQCEPYVETTCWTQNVEDCKPVSFNNCTGVIETDIERVCFDVNELVCDLVETIHYETLEETPSPEMLYWQGQSLRHHLQDRHDYQGRLPVYECRDTELLHGGKDYQRCYLY